MYNFKSNLNNYHPHIRVGNVFGQVCLSVCLCVCLCVCLSVFLFVQAITFEPLDVESLLLACRYIKFEYPGHWVKVKVISEKMIVLLISTS